jgi:hypothetical protein
MTEHGLPPLPKPPPLVSAEPAYRRSSSGVLERNPDASEFSEGPVGHPPRHLPPPLWPGGPRFLTTPSCPRPHQR